MARESESKEKKSKKRRESSDVDSEDEGRSKRHRRAADEKLKKKSSKEGGSREEKSRHRKSEKDSKHKTGKGKKSEGKDNSSPPEDHLHSETGFSELSNDDYFSKNNEFATWLKEERNMFFSNLSSELARQLFTEFIKDWNQHKLEAKYYKGIASGPRTAHKWKIKA